MPPEVDDGPLAAEPTQKHPTGPLGRARYAIVALALVIAAGIAVVFAGGTDPADVAEIPTAEEVLAEEPGPPAPPVEVEGWLNSPPLDASDLDGEVVIYDFWTYSCINCIRTMPYLRAWYDRYRDDGLQIIGVHSPEFEFEQVDANIERAVADNGITWPVAMDDEMTTWDSFGNRYWPAKYVYDRDGRLRFTHFGEGAYEETENVLRALLGVDSDSPRASLDEEASEEGSQLPSCDTEEVLRGIDGCQSPEMYLGADRGSITLSSPEPLQEGTVDFTVPEDQPLHTVALAGTWEVGRESVSATEAGSSMVVQFEANEVNLVLAPPETGPVQLTVELDGEPVASEDRGADIVEQPDGTTTIEVGVDDLYALIALEDPGVHSLTLTAQGPGVSGFAFTYGS